MCSRTIVGLLLVSVVCGEGLPAGGSQQQEGSYFIKDDDPAGAARRAALGDEPIFVELKAHNPSPPNGACVASVQLLSWTPGFTAIFHNLYFGTNPNLGNADFRVRLPKAQTQCYILQPLAAGTYYWRVDEVAANSEVIRGDLWCFTIGPCGGCAIVNLCCDPLLTWPPVEGAVKYHVYFGDNQSEVAARSAATDKGTTDQTVLPLGSLQSGTTYYWVVDAVLANGEYLAGSLQSCTVPVCPGGGVLREWWLDLPGTSVNDLTNAGVPDGQECLDCFEGPTDWADNYGSRLSAVLLPPVSGAYTFWIASDDNSQLWLSSDDDPANLMLIAFVSGWTSSRQWDKYPEQKSNPLLLSGGKRYYIQAVMKEGSGGDNIAVAWQGPGMLERKVICVPYVENPACTPFLAHEPYPRDGDPYVDPAPILRWHAGREAVQHEVYFSDDFESVALACQCACPAYRGRQSRTTYDPGPLVPGRTYYWRVDEINDASPASPWRGCVWSFTVTDDCRILLDNFESYTDFDPIQTYWESTPYPVTLERTIVHGGWQSMRIDYDNTIPPHRSEAWPNVLTLGSGIVADASSLCLWVRGGSPKFEQTGEDCYTISAAGTDIWNNTDEFRYAYKQLSGDGSITARVQSLTNTNSWAKAGVMIRASLDPGSPHAMVVVTPGNGVSFQRRLVAGGASEDTTLPGPRAPYWVKLTRQGNTLTGEHSPDGVTWTNFGPGVSVVTLPSLSSNVYIGLAATSHDAAAVTVAKFCPVSLTGSITGSWQVADIGVVQPGNEPCPLYVRVEDSAGHSATVYHPDSSLVVSGTWKPWCIPLRDFAGVNPVHLKTVAIGVGDPRDPAPGCAGWFYVDDICLR